MCRNRLTAGLTLFVVSGMFLCCAFVLGCSTTSTTKNPQPIRYQPVQYERRVSNSCSVCGATAVYWCPVRRAWFCHDHAAKTYTPGGGYYYRCR
jgi:hypothetical protein